LNSISRSTRDNQDTVRPAPGSRRDLRLLDVAGTENVKYRLACRKQIIGDDSPFGIRIPPILATRELTSSVI
jgi:hypothetical protein